MPSAFPKNNGLDGRRLAVSCDHDVANPWDSLGLNASLDGACRIQLGLVASLDGVALVCELAILNGSLSCIGILCVRAITV